MDVFLIPLWGFFIQKDGFTLYQKGKNPETWLQHCDMVRVLLVKRGYRVSAGGLQFANINCRSMMRHKPKFPARKSEVVPSHAYFPFNYMKATLLPAPRLNIDIGCKSCIADINPNP